MDILSKKIKHYKVQLNLTNADIAERTGLPENTIARICSGRTKDPKLTTLKLLAQAFECELDDLLGNEDAVQPYYLDKETGDLAQSLKDNKELKISVLGSFDTFAANKYVYKGTENAPSQTVTSVKKINNNLSVPLSIQLNYTPTVPNTAMSNSSTLFFIGIILLLSGLGIFYTSAKKN